MDYSTLKEAWSNITYYVENTKGRSMVYRTLAFKPEVIILLSPHKDKIKTAYYKRTLEPGLIRINKKKADYILSSQYRNYTESWNWLGQKYKVSENFSEDLYEIAPKHHGNFRIGWYRGKLYWFILYANSYPQLSCSKFPLHSIDEEPGTGDGTWSWAQLHNIKPVYNVTKKRYI